MKRKELEPWTQPWFDAWKKLLENEVVIRAEIEFRVQCIDFSATLMYLEKGVGVHQVKCERSLGLSIDVPKTILTCHDAPYTAYLEDMHDYWAHSPRRFPAENWIKPVAHAAIAQPFLSSNLHALQPSHQLLQSYYGMILEGLRTQRRETGESIERRLVWETIERRFRTFLTLQELSIFENTIGHVLSS